MSTTAEDLSDRVAAELLTYLNAGTINPDAVTAALDYSDLGIADFDRLKRLRFVLSEPVVDFVDELPPRLRRLKTVNTRERIENRGEVRGAIDWPQTLRRRSESGYRDPSVFITQTPAVQYDIAENRVLKKLLSHITTTLSEEIEGVDRDWRSMWSDSEIIQLQRQLAQHVHLSRLPSPESITVTPRELERARQSRHVLYVESQQLLQQYRDLMEDRFDRASVQELLRETFIQPADRPTLFELFCTFRILHQLELHAEGLTLQPMSSSGSGNVLAELSDERRSIRVAHDSTGTMEFEALFPQMSDLESHEGFEGIRQYRRAKDAYAAEMFGVHPATALFSGRPDVLIEVRDRQRSGNPLQTIIIGEVKYTTRTQTLQNGLRELLEYMHFVQESGYLYPDQEQVTVRGILCSDGVETISEHVEDVIHLTTSDLNEKSETGRLSALVSVSYS